MKYWKEALTPTSHISAEAVLQDSALASLVLVVAVLGIVVHAVLTRSVFGAPATQSVLKVFQTLINRNINDYLI